MSDDIMHNDSGQNDPNEEGQITYTQISSCAIGNYTSAPQRQSLRAKLEREREELEQRQQKSLVNTFRDLFG